ncbi:hypothetical protein PTSG_09236 [Salpingoeca rosetta]|uniref:THO complex subunit 2 n=1 Tax=Salpingoeca rosetta (strain ATCC 50818 / BSB-021) TaxID=946362 RepID=F2UN45_SALR5|nr:uncharacterized protein PTSG_09236 [Salpingoeca rosetta]EGD78544.1 hypothetical protein PTSG_09236 [Salpingoeca rosetta]|eukprot:XP_004989493.1 hypothetical protein PTSG_09236 [Salpingoeca rosetta]
MSSPLAESTTALVAALQDSESFSVGAVEVLRDVFAGFATGDVSADDITAFLQQDVIKENEGFDVIAADSLMLAVAENKANETKMHELVKAVFASGAIDQSILRERLDIAVLKACKLVPADYDKGLMRMRMKMFYKQEKYNLFHEENEGFAKVVTELGQDFTAASVTADDLITRIRTLVGFFNLDPNRVLDLMLDALEEHPQHAAVYTACLAQFTTAQDSIANLIGLKLAAIAKQPGPPPTSLYATIAHLMDSGLLSLSALEPHLLPTLEETRERVRAYVKSVTKYVNTSAMSQEVQAQLDAAAAAADVDELKAKQRDQRLGLAVAFLKNGNWDLAEKIMSQLPAFYVPSLPAARTAMLTTLHHCIEPLYRSVAATKLSRPCPAATASSSSSSSSSSSMPACTSLVDFAARVMPALSSLGPFLADDPVLMTKAVRVCAHLVSLAKEAGEKSTAMLAEVEDLFARCILPSLMRCSSNAPIAADVWAALQQLPYQARFKIYGYWKNESWKNQPELLLVRAKTFKKAKSLFQRLTAENAGKKMAHDLSKVAFTNPVHLFEYALRQIEAYSNLVEPLSDALKTHTHLAYDILSFCVLEALSNPQKSRMKKEDLFESSWLQNLAAFVGLILRKYPVDFEPILQFIINRLKENQVLDLIVLREIITKIAGYENAEDMTDMQLQAMAGGQILRQRGSTFSNARLTKDQRRALKHMTETFTSAQDEILIPLIILIAQQRVELVFGGDKERPVVLIGELYDKCQEVLMQLMQCVEANISESLYFKRLPPLEELCTTYHLEVDTAMFLHRRRLTASIEDLAADKSQTGTAVQKYMRASETAMKDVTSFLKSLHPPAVWTELSPQLYSTFWTLSLYDLETPSAAYAHVIAELEEANRQNRPAPGDTSRTEKRKRREITSNEATIKALKEEESRQKAVVKCAHEMLTSLSKSFVQPSHSLKSVVVSEFLRLCIYPRCFFSAADAVYCAKFAVLLHSMRTENWSTLLYFNFVFKHTACIIMSATENEASRYGRFLNETMRVLARFHADPSVYQKECAPTPGFIASFNKNEPQTVKFADYRKMCYNWQTRLLKDFLSMLNSKDPSLIRRAVLVMIKVVDHFPRMKNLAKVLLEAIEQILKDETTRQDVKLLVTSYNRQLLDRSGTWVPANVYNPTDTKSAAKKAPASSGKAAASPAKKAKATTDKSSTSSSSSKTDGKKIATKSNSSSSTPAKTTSSSSNSKRTPKSEHKSSSSSSSRKSSGSSGKKSESNKTPKDEKRRSSKDDKSTAATTPTTTTTSSSSSSKRRSSTDPKSGKDHGRAAPSPSSSSSSSRARAPPPLPSRGGSTEDLQPKRAKVSSSSSSSRDRSGSPPPPPTERESRRSRDRRGDTRSAARDTRLPPPPSRRSRR